jgi:hypothetical protein
MSHALLVLGPATASLGSLRLRHLVPDLAGE